mmetsp:Transcript_102838/g.286353  ORF Transcript_102838/g.286353 Transcript_102838/m.286353 type:complete len:208 (-) Transcript_102838:158-781(-)
MAKGARSATSTARATPCESPPKTSRCGSPPGRRAPSRPSNSSSRTRCSCSCAGYFTQSPSSAYSNHEFISPTQPPCSSRRTGAQGMTTRMLLRKGTCRRWNKGNQSSGPPLHECSRTRVKQCPPAPWGSRTMSWASIYQGSPASSSSLLSSFQSFQSCDVECHFHTSFLVSAQSFLPVPPSIQSVALSLQPDVPSIAQPRDATCHPM